ncbi:penicillin-binding protein 2 [Candidatus Uhrbacteria bacterium CG10_big_fil_rev_8_21_14_0_10_50_16]|uniref:Penicillin-binding protein 2 n=1 Tax=Candidatus Uhrbacteria bacterium CG10_big_fil_rev_8_21_14_0_10_50_16 TaxID=1975039 RepID=A0A2H0RN02_9BACT|nr:MAG: penicillin-binding protein 2 [Candidatus Uhrbacteria bacterium CG10_big_fil_rev_8_21_14_0_10_50_16]
MNQQSPFSIQPMDGLGVIPALQEDIDFEDTLGHTYRNRSEADFIGTSITETRWKWAGITMAVLFALLLGQAAQLQIWHGNSFYAQAEGNRIRDEVIPADRGRILDRSGTVLVNNIPAFSLWIKRDVLDDSDKYLAAIDQMALLLNEDVHELHDQLLSSDGLSDELLVTHNMPTAAALEVLASPEAYEYLRVEAGVRRYDVDVQSQTLSALLGYTGSMNEDEYAEYRQSGYQKNELIGKIGIEESYEQVLRGFPGTRRVEVDAVGHPQSILEKRDAVDGATLTLHIDAGLQAMIEAHLAQLENEQGIRNASVVVMDPRDGGIRALVSYPGFDSNLFMDKIDQDQYRALLEDPARPLFSRALSGQFPSGSTFKPIVAAAALDAGVITEHTTVLSTGGIRIGQFFFPDWKAGGHGIVDVRKAIADSVNTFFYMIGGGYLDFEGLGLDRMMTSAAAFGLGQPLGIDVPHEASGFLPSAAWKNEVKQEPWYIGDTYHVSIGQGDILVTPLQVAAFTTVFANGGTLFEPQVVDRYESQGKIQDIAPRIINSETASPEAIAIVREGLRQTVTQGSGRRLNGLPIPVAGKTGTAQWHSTKENHAWFTGFAPYDDPELVVTILIEEGGEGSAVAVPLAYDIFDWWFYKE